MDTWETVLVSAAVAFATAVAAAPVRLWVERLLLSHRLQTEYAYEQRRELHSLIGRYHGRLVEAAEQMHFRLNNVYEHDPDRWLFSRKGHYMTTTCYRFLQVIGLSRSFERDAFYIDARISEERDLDVLRFVKAFNWSLSDPHLFFGLKYEESESTDHFFSDELRRMGDDFLVDGDRTLLLKEFEERLATGTEFDEIIDFVYGLTASEERLRWDRVVVFDLLLVAFLNTVGYSHQKVSDADIATLVGRIRHEEIRENLVAWIPRLGLEHQDQMTRIVKALDA